MKKRAAVLLLAALLAFSSSNTALAAASGPTPLSPFPDLSADHWSFPYVSDLVSQGVVSGCDDGNFQGGRNVTWGEVFKLILLAVGAEEPERDPDHHWAYCYIQPALNERLVYHFSEDMLDEDSMVCPHCGETLEFDFEDDEDEDIDFQELSSDEDEDGEE